MCTRTYLYEYARAYDASQSHDQWLVCALAGSFGRVMLVARKANRQQYFALKILDKAKVSTVLHSYLIRVRVLAAAPSRPLSSAAFALPPCSPPRRALNRALISLKLHVESRVIFALLQSRALMSYSLDPSSQQLQYSAALRNLSSCVLFALRPRDGVLVAARLQTYSDSDSDL